MAPPNAGSRWRSAGGDPADTRCLVVDARSPDGQLQGLLTFVPWGPDGLSLDLMHRAPTAPNGITEFMVDETVVARRALGIERISLNFVAFRSALENGVRLGAGRSNGPGAPPSA